MTSVADYSARGKIASTFDGGVVFHPVNTNYQMHLRCAAPYTGAVGKPVDVSIRLMARKVYSVPSGGNFITPIFGPPKIIQGRVKFMSETQLVVHAGATVVVDLPAGASSIDLNSGAIAVGSMVNVVAIPGAMLELISTVGVV